MKAVWSWIVAGVLLVLLFLYLKSKLKTAVSTTLNPASDKNIVNSTLSSIGQSVTGDKSWSLDGALSDALSSVFPSTAEQAVNARAAAPAPAASQSDGFFSSIGSSISDAVSSIFPSSAEQAVNAQQSGSAAPDQSSVFFSPVNDNSADEVVNVLPSSSILMPDTLPVPVVAAPAPVVVPIIAGLKMAPVPKPVRKQRPVRAFTFR